MWYEKVWRKNLKYRHFRPKSPSFALHRTAGLCTWPWLSKRLLPGACRVACVAGIKRGRGRGNLGFPLLKPATQATCRAIFVSFIFFSDFSVSTIVPSIQYEKLFSTSWEVSWSSPPKSLFSLLLTLFKFTLRLCYPPFLQHLLISD